jgi:2-haloacid dehalogenase
MRALYHSLAQVATRQANFTAIFRPAQERPAYSGAVNFNKEEEGMVDSSRRNLIRRGTALAATGALAAAGFFTPSRARAQGASVPMPEVKALVFDTFGTVVDWRNGVAREAERLLKPLGYELDWLAFAEAWRKEYQPAMDEIRSGRRPFVKLDILHRENLDRIAARFKLEKLDAPMRDQLNLAWHKLDAWPDVGPGFARLHKRFLMAPCSNGNIALMANVARRNNIPWDAILGSEIAQGYKPQPKVYLMTCEAFNLKPHEVMMCAAHSGDLSSAQKLGLRTGHIGRPGEGGPGTGETEPKGQFDVVGKNFHDFADKLGV